MTEIDVTEFHRQLADAAVVGGYVVDEAASALLAELRFQRAVQTYLWALPAVSLEAMRRAQRDAFGPGSNVLAIWQRIDAKTCF